MQAFNFQVKWVPGKLHLVADALSRAPHFSPHADELKIETSFAVLKNLHSAHVGVDRTMSLTKQLFFWHGMLNDITTTINSCGACQLYIPSQKKKVISSRPLKEAAFSFQECAADLFSLHGNDYIVLVNRLTGFICFEKLSKTYT